MLKIISYNLLSAGHESERWQERLANAIEMVREREPDVIGFQECEHRQLSVLSKELADYRWAGVATEGSQIGDFVVMFYNPECVALVETSHFWLSESPDRRGSLMKGALMPRVFLATVLKDSQTDDSFLIGTTHLDYGPESVRLQSAEMILEFISKRTKNQKVVLMGDFNDRANDSALYQKLVADNSLQDSHLIANQSSDQATFLGKGEFHGSRIDWILLSDNVQIESAGIVNVEKYASDHHPVFANIS